MYDCCEEVRTSEKDFSINKPNKDTVIYFINNGFFNIARLPFACFVLANILHCYGIYRVIKNDLYLPFAFGVPFFFWGGVGMICGCHKLWAHRSYKGTSAWSIFLMLGHSTTGLFTIFSWAAGHRIHHKFSDTDADPHNSSRGFTFAHCGWVFKKQHPEHVLCEKKLDFADLKKDPVVQFQERNFLALFLVLNAIPVGLTYALFDISLLDAALINGVLRIMATFHSVALINSAAHMFGYREYAENIRPGDFPLLMMFAMGESCHNYHHAFPWDYASGEDWLPFNISKIVIDIAAKFGLTFEHKKATRELLNMRKEKNARERSTHISVGRRVKSKIKMYS